MHYNTLKYLLTFYHLLPVSVRVTFTDRDGDEHTVDAKLGDSLLEVAKEYDIDLEGKRMHTLSNSSCDLVHAAAQLCNVLQ